MKCHVLILQKVKSNMILQERYLELHTRNNAS